MNNILEGNVVDIKNRRIFRGKVEILKGRILSIIETDEVSSTNYILPGFIDSHIHIESSMLVPSEFARAAVVHGTVATVSDPHEIANVLGTRGIDFMVENASKVPMKFYFGVPSCVPATSFESSGAVIDSAEVANIFGKYQFKYLSEMMNFPGVVYGDQEVAKKLQIAKDLGKVIDGHAPGLSGEMLKNYVESGISTDHECFTIDEAREKIALGMKVLIREGSAAKNFDSLHPLITENPKMCMLCSDDKHPDDFADGHINRLIKKSLSLGHDLFDVLQVAIANPINHYSLEGCIMSEGDPADINVIDNLIDFNVLQTYIDGQLVAENGKSYINSIYIDKVNVFNAKPISASDIAVNHYGGKIKVIEAIEGELITNSILIEPKVENDMIVSDIENDILKLVVYNRYSDTRPAVAFIKNFNFKSGAVATSVAHDSHNIIAVGTNDSEIANAINLIIDNKGGLAVVQGNDRLCLALPVAGIMSDQPLEIVAKRYGMLNSFAQRLGTTMNAPFMTLSFMALLVIPKLKLSDKGLFDGETFNFTNLEEI